MKTKIFTLLLFLSFFFSAFSANFYWIGGTGNWTSTSHWSATSGGATVGSLPSSSDNVYFDANSSTTAFIATIDAGVTVNNIVITTDSLHLKSTGQTIACANFSMNSTGTLDFTNTNVNFSGTNWTLQNNPTVIFVNSPISILNTGAVQFNGNGKTFNDIISNAATLTFLGGNTFDLVKLSTVSTLIIEDGTTLTLDSLSTSGTCGQLTKIQSLNPGSGFAQLKKKGYHQLIASYVNIDSVNAINTGGYSYLLKKSMLDASSGWTPTGQKYYWVGNGGNWSDLNHWASVSGGTPSATCLPSYGDSVIFDNQSFSSANQTVTGDVKSYFSYMNWTGVTQNPTWDLDSSAFSNGDVILDPTIATLSSNLDNAIEFTGTASLNTQGVVLNFNLSVNMFSSSESLSLTHDLTIVDSLGIYLSSGNLDLNNKDLSMGSILVSSQPGTTKSLDLSSSSIIIYIGFNAENATNFTFNAGTSNLYIGDTLPTIHDTILMLPITRTNYLITSGLTFNKVTLDFRKNHGVQRLAGNNTFNDLTILKKGDITIDQSTTQTVQNKLLINGTCKDSVYLSSSASPPAFFHFTGSTTVDISCCYFDTISATGASPTAYFSQGVGGSTGWNFSTTPATVSSFTSTGDYCLGDTTHFTNNSTVISGSSTDLTSNWYFHDGTGYFEYSSPQDSTFIGYQTDTNQHVFLDKGDFNVVLEAIDNISLCKSYDTVLVHISSPSALLSSSINNHIICKNDSVVFNVSSDSPTAIFQFYVNGASVTGMSANDTIYTTAGLQNNDTISVLSFENGCVSPTEPDMIFKVNDLPVAALATNPTNTTVCSQDTVIFTASSSDSIVSYQYLLNDAPVFVGPTYSNSLLQNNDIISLVAIDTNGCRDTISKAYTVNPLPITTLSSSNNNNVICAGTQLVFTANGANKYEFFVNNVSQGTPSTVNTFSTTSLTSGQEVRVLGYSSAGCKEFASQEFSYTVNALPSILLSASEATSICSGTNVQFTANGGSQYEFFVNNISVQGPSSLSSFNTDTLNNNDEVYVEGSFSGCADTSSHKIFLVTTTPTVTLSSNATGDTLCKNTPITFTSSGATNYEFFIDGVSQGAPSPSAMLSTSSLNNNQTVTVEGVTNGCAASKTISMTVLPIPSVGLFSNDPDNTICNGDPITFTATNSANYQFLVDNTPAGAVQPTSTFTPTLSSGVHIISVVGFGTNGCSDTTQTAISLTINPIPNVVLTSSDPNNEICANESVTFTGSGSNKYQFYIDGSSQGNLSTTNTFVSSSLQNGQTITVFGSSLGCTNTSNSISIVVHPSPNVGMVSTDIDNIFCEGDAVVYTASGAADYEFFVNHVSQGAPSAVQSINTTGFASGSYPITVVGTQNNCTDSTSVLVTVNNLPTTALTTSVVNDSICSGENVVYTATGGNLYEFFINGNSQGSAGLLNTFSSSSLSDGDIVSAEVTSTVGCKNGNTLPAIHVLSSPTINMSSSVANDTICSNDQIVLTGSGGTKYRFFINGVAQGPFSSSPTLTSNTLQDGDQIYVVGDNFGCQSQSLTQSFTVFAYPIVSLVNNGESQICDNEPTNISANGATSYQFMVNNVPVGPFSPSANFNGVVNNNDVVTVMGSLHGCVSSAATNIQFVVLPYPTLSVISSSANSIICKDEQVTLSTSGATTYMYQLNNEVIQSGSNSSYSNSDLENGDSITVTGYNGDCASSDSVFVFTVNTMNLSLLASPSNNVCPGTAVSFNATGADEYQFYVNGVAQGTFSTSSSFNLPSVSDLDTVSFVGKNSTTQCEQENGDYMIMNVMNEPTISSTTPLDFCEGDSVVLMSNSSYGNQWLLNGTPLVGATDTSYVANQSGTYSLAVTHGGSGNIWSFGDNGSGVFGDSTNFNSTLPKQAESTESFVSLSSGADFVLALDDLGDVYAWGLNNYGQLGNGSYTNSNLPLLVPSLSNIKCVATSAESSMALTASGDVYVWGENIVGQLGTGNTSVINFPFINPNISNVDTIVGGENHFLFLKNDGSVWAVGGNNAGQLGTGDLVNAFVPQQVSGLSNIVAIGAGDNTSFAIDQNGKLYAWGENEEGQLGLGDLTNRLTPALSSLKHVVAAMGGAKHSVFLTANKEVFTVGQNNDGQLGKGDFIDRDVPSKVAVSGVKQIAAGKTTTLLRRVDGNVFGFGSNTFGQLSTLSGNSINTPTILQLLEGVTFIDGGRISTHAIFGQSNSCVSSNNQTVAVTAVPYVDISVANGVDLSTSVSGNAYQWYLDGLPIPNANQSTFTATANGDYSIEVTFGNGCSGTSDVLNISLLSVDENDALYSLVGYPNPTTGDFNLVFNKQLQNKEVTIYLFNAIGKKIKEIHTLIQPTIHFSLSNFAKGSYQLEVVNSDFMRVLKVIKE